MPEEKSENQPDSEPHEPSDEQKRSAFNIFELFQHRNPFGDFPSGLREDFRLKNERNSNCINILAQSEITLASFCGCTLGAVFSEGN